ncbi:MAG: hypothetical protein IKD31_01110 [Clostridia bacterium]|nr:hypothetical protein [Clostridia bacterium]
MKKVAMKRVVALLLLFVTLSVSLCSCKVDMDDMGAIIPMYIASPQMDLDPTEMIYDKDFLKVSGLLYAGLTQVNKSGKIEYVLASDWEQKYNADREEYFLYIDLISTRWNDGRTFTADHVVYAWKRILSPETASPAAALLYDLKNARDVKAGVMTIDDLGVAAVDADTVEVQFERPIDPELFLEAISSPALVPLRDDVIQGKEEIWSTNVNDIATNGHFAIKKMDPEGEYRLDFSKYFRLPKTPEDGYNVYVKPYQLVTNFSWVPSAADAITQFDNKEIYYVGSFTSDTYNAKEKDIESSDTLTSYTYFFDCENEVLADARVRKALSIALDREQIASIIGLGSKAANGFVADIATGSTMKKSFRKEAGAVYSTKADSAAQSLLSQAGVTSGSFEITYREDREYDVLVAEYAKGVWEALGFTVSLKGLGVNSYEKALYAGEFDVIALDYQGLSTNPYSFLAPFSPAYSGSVVSVDATSSGIAPHVTAYNSEAYTALLDQILEETTRSGRHAKLIELEKLFAEECPATAMVFYSHNYLASSDLKGLDVSPYGYTIFADAVLKDYKERNEDYLAKVEALLGEAQ